MSKIVLLGDLHGNMTATLAMEQELKRIEPDEIWFLGDAVGKGPDSDKVVDWIREHCKYSVVGNWDSGIFEKRMKTHAYYCNQLGEERLEWLRKLPAELELRISGVCFRVFHGRPTSNEMVQGMDSDEVLTSYFVTEKKKYGGIICADSHRPFVRVTDLGYALNTGSVGINMGLTQAHGLLLEGEKDCMDVKPLRISILSVPYDHEKEARIAMERVELPLREEYVKEIMTGVHSGMD